MANTVIAVRSSGTAAATPSLGVIANGEIALNFADGIIYYKTSSNTLGSIRTTQPAGLTTEVQFNDAGSFGANSGFTFSPSISCDSALVDFDALIDGAPSPTTYSWNFGNGNTSNLQYPPSQLYSTPGDYVVTLQTDILGYKITI